MQTKQKSIIFGRHPVVDAIKSGTPVDKLILQQGIRGEFEKEIRHLSQKFNIPCQVVPKERIGKMTRGNHQGIIAMLSMIPYYKLEDVLPTIYEKSETPLILILDGVTDVRNFGAIARTAECCGAQAIVIPQKGSAQINADAVKTSAGALTKIMVCRERNIQGAIDYLQLSGIQVLASDLRATKAIYELDMTLPTALIIGSENLGIHPTTRNKADETFIIPQKGTTDSFNVSVAAGMMMYEVMRQRKS